MSFIEKSLMVLSSAMLYGLQQLEKQNYMLRLKGYLRYSVHKRTTTTRLYTLLFLTQTHIISKN